MAHNKYQPIDKFRYYRRYLPHWENPGSIYFITFRTMDNIKLITPAKDIVSRSLKYLDGKKYHLFSYVIMSNHVHIIIQPIKKTDDSFFSLSEIMHSIKGFTAQKINRILNRRGVLWQHESFDRILRDEEEMLEKINYMDNNPVKSGLSNKPGEYRWFYIRDNEPFDF